MYEDPVQIVAAVIATTKDVRTGEVMIGRQTLKRAKAVIDALEKAGWVLRDA